MKYEVGDIVEVINKKYGHRFEIGDKVRVRTLCEDGTVDSCEYLDKSDHWFIDEEEIRYIQGELQ